MSKPDLIDRLISQWRDECPNLDPNAMGIVGRIMLLGRKFEKDAAEALRPFSIHYTDFDIIATIRRSGHPYELAPGELSETVLLSSGAMTAALDRLQLAGLITRHESTSDRRVKTAQLTKSGIKLAESAAQVRFDTADDALLSLSKTDQKLLSRLLKKLSS